jgi:quaternary ammonium compound-resistance protein SugE
MSHWAQLLLAAVLNIGTVYFIKASDGMTRWWPTLGVIVTILLTQFLVARVMASGGQVAAAIVAVVVAVMVGSGVIGYFAFGERLSALQIAGYAIAVLGVMIAGLAPSAA